MISGGQDVNLTLTEIADSQSLVVLIFMGMLVYLNNLIATIRLLQMSKGVKQFHFN